LSQAMCFVDADKCPEEIEIQTGHDPYYRLGLRRGEDLSRFRLV
jgi:hypothetical protein